MRNNNLKRIATKTAFEQALTEGRLSLCEYASNYIGNYMYMGPSTRQGKQTFKHIVTREYIK